MNNPAFIALLQNAALLLALVVVFDLAAGRQRTDGRPLRQIAVGLILGGLCMALIHTSFRLESGIVFDTRSVLLGVSGLFFGAVPTVVAMAVAAAFRLLKGGVGAWTGVAVTLATGALGILWRRFRKGRLQDVSSRELYAFGVAAHLVMLALMLTLPRDSARHVLAAISLPVLLVYPVATAALGLLLANRLRREQAADALGISERRFRTFVENAPDAIFIQTKGLFAYVNPAAVKLFGAADAQRLLGTPVTERFRPEYRSAIAERVRRLNVDRQPVSQAIHRVQRCDDTAVDAEFSGVPFEYEGENGALVFVRDVSERLQAEEALRESEERFRMLIENAPEGIFVQADGRFLFVNPALARMLGAARPDDLIGANVLSFIAPEYVPAVRDRIRRQRETGSVAPPMEQEYLRLDGARMPVETTAVPIKFAGREAHLVFIRDVAERRRIEREKQNLQAQLAQAQKMDSIGRLAGGVAHDFNNMLGVILGHADLALDGLDPASPLHAGLREIRKAAIRSGDLTRQLLAFARKQTIAPKALDLNETVEGMLQMLRRLIGENVELAWHPCPVPARVKMDPSQLDQILANLCVNARDAVGDKGHVAIETGLAEFDEKHCAAHAGHLPGRFVMLAVRDDGCGMDSQTLLRLFEPFFTTKEVGKGTGLGLATVYGIVKQNDGFIVVDSQPGQGSTFRIYLPLLRESGAAEAPAAPPPIPGGHETILLVEDEPALLNMTRRMLEQIGYRVLPAATPAEALRLAKRESGRIDLLMTDVVMPQMNGRNLGQILAEEVPGLKRLFMSGYTADVIAHHGVLDPGVHFIAKPFTPAELAAKIRQVLAPPPAG